MLKTVWRTRVVQPLVALLTQGVTPEKLALSVAFGVALGLFPVLGTTTVLCTVAAVVFRLNLPAIQVANYLVYPLQLLLLLPFFRAGAWLFGATPLPLSARQVAEMFHRDFWRAMSLLFDTTWHAAVVWLLLAPPGIVLLSRLLTPLFRRWAPGRSP